MGSVRRPASSHRTASALLRGGRLRLAYHDDEEQPHGQLGRRLRQDGVAKGVSFRSAVFKHAFRNSFIPIASTLGQLITILVSGSILIESVFDIQGFGLLQYQALLGRDQTVIMGTLTIAAFLLVLGNILSDLIVAMVDPRVKFN